MSLIPKDSICGIEEGMDTAEERSTSRGRLFCQTKPFGKSKIEKVPRGIQGKKSSKDMASSRNLVSTIWAQASPKKVGTEPSVWKGKRSLLAYNTRSKCPMETTHNSAKVKLSIKVMKLVESLISWEVTVGQGSECHLTFVRGRLHIAK